VADVLPLINRLNRGTYTLPTPTVNEPPWFYDVNGDGQLTPVGDVLPIINRLNRSTNSTVLIVATAPAQSMRIVTGEGLPDDQRTTPDAVPLPGEVTRIASAGDLATESIGHGSAGTVRQVNATLADQVFADADFTHGLYELSDDVLNSLAPAA
jgi:hypothetical protein